MSVQLIRVGFDEENNIPVFEAQDLQTGESVEVKNWFEKSKSKWHVVLAQNSANRKYVSHNEIKSKIDENGTYIIEDKTSQPRVIGTSKPDKKLIPYMTEEEKEDYKAIIARAVERRNAEKNRPLSEEEKLQKQIEKLQAKLAERRAAVASTSMDMDEDEDEDECVEE